MRLIETLEAYLKETEAIPFRDTGDVVTIAGGDAIIEARTIKECIRRVKEVTIAAENNSPSILRELQP